MKLEALLKALQSHAETLDTPLLHEIQTLANDLQSNLTAARETGRNLRIAVIGQMKAGKSSFLNAAFFGHDLLPKADTPMTAALTKIVYAPKARAEVEFYSADDWEGIKRRALDYDRCYAEEERKLMDELAPQNSSPFAKPIQPRKPSAEEVARRIPLAITSSRELVHKAHQKNLNVNDYLGKTKQIDNIASAVQLASALQDYVGSNGHFTAITKMLVLHIDDPRLKGIEIIDTPGFNDPVVSRGQITRSFLGQSDVIFLLSNIGQFLTAADMSVLREQLPEAGIDDKAVFLVGSQRDLALRQDRQIAQMANKLAEREPPAQRNGARAAAMMQLLDKKMSKLATQTLDMQINLPGIDGKTRRILGAIKQTKPCFISSWAWMVAEHFDQMSRDDRYHLQELQRATGYTFTPDTLRQLSNIPSLRNELLAQSQRKADLLAHKEQALIAGAHAGIRERLSKMLADLANRSERIRTSSIAELEKTALVMVKRMNSGRAKLEDVFDQQFVKASQQFALLKTDIRKEAQKYNKIETVRETKTESYQTSASTWYNPLSWGNSETHYRDVVTIYASAQDAIEQLETFALQSTISLQKAIVNCVDIDGMRREVGRAAMGLFDTGDACFDADLMLAEVNKSIRHITIPDVDFGRKDYSLAIVKAFGSDRVSESQISALKEAQRESVTLILADLEAEMEQKINIIGSSLENTSKTFVERMTDDIQKSLTQLRNDIANKEISLQRIEDAKSVITESISKLVTQQHVAA